MLESHLQSLIAWFSAHPNVAVGGVFAAAALESLALVGTVIPGSSFVILGGVLIGLGALDPWPTAAAAVIGAVVGDGLSYWLGHHYRERLPHLWPLSRHPQWLARGQAYFEQHGGKSVFLGRFFSPVRAFIPVVAGMADMPPARFYLANVLSAFVWAGAHLVPGWLLGASLQLAGAVSGRLALMLVAVVVVLWALGKLVHAVFTRTWPRITALRDRVVERARRGSGATARIVLSLLDPARPESPALLVGALVLIGGASVFLGILEGVLADDPLIGLDQSVYQALQSLRTAWADRVMVFITGLGGTPGTLPVIIATAGWLAFRRRWRTLAYWLAAAGFAEAVVLLLKVTVGRARPNTVYAGAEQFSFPSGHAAMAIVTYGFLAFLLARGKPPGIRALVVVPVTVGVVLTAFSRLYLGVHWLSDVVASLGLGIAWVALLGIAYTQHAREAPLRAAPVLLIVGSTLTLAGLLYVGPRVPADVLRYAQRPAPVTVALAHWQADGWRSLPAARSELGGEREEPFALQWVATEARIGETLADAGWRAPPPWDLRTALLWLLPGTPVAALPVLPKFDHGEAPTLTRVRVTGERERLVIRLWPMREVVAAQGAAPGRPLWVGMVTRERLEHPGGAFTRVRTERDAVTPMRSVESDLRAAGVALALPAGRDSPPLLAWQVP